MYGSGIYACLHVSFFSGLAIYDSGDLRRWFFQVGDLRFGGSMLACLFKVWRFTSRGIYASMIFRIDDLRFGGS